MGADAWTQKEIDYLKKCYKNGLSPAMFAKELGRSISSIYRKASVLGITKHNSQKSIYNDGAKEKCLNCDLPDCTNCLGGN